MVWGAFSANGVGKLVRIKGVLVKEKYRQILVKHAVPCGKKLIGKPFVLQQDNDPKHTAHVVKRYLDKKEKDGDLKLLDWPSQSPDLNPIENLWRMVDDKTKSRKPANEDKLFEVLRHAWMNIEDCITKKLVSSMRRRCEAVIANHGYPTKY
jgi:hypothetical protein